MQADRLNERERERERRGGGSGIVNFSFYVNKKIEKL